MAKIKITLGIVVLLISMALTSCTKYGYIDGGVSIGVHDCSMWDYMAKYPADWDSTRLMIEHAGLKSLFEGKSTTSQITFIGVTNHVIRRFMLEYNESQDELEKPQYWKRVKDIPSDKCKELLEKLIIPKRLMVNDVPRGNRVKKTVDGTLVWVNERGATYKTIDGVELFLYTFKEPYNNVPEGGPIRLYIANPIKNSATQQIVSSNIQTTNGIVQTLSYGFKFNNL